MQVRIWNILHTSQTKQQNTHLKKLKSDTRLKEKHQWDDKIERVQTRSQTWRKSAALTHKNLRGGWTMRTIMHHIFTSLMATSFFPPRMLWILRALWVIKPFHLPRSIFLFIAIWVKLPSFYCLHFSCAQSLSHCRLSSLRSSSHLLCSPMCTSPISCILAL